MCPVQRANDAGSGRIRRYCRQQVVLYLGVFHKSLQAVYKVGAVEGVATDADHRGLTQALSRRLIHGLVRQRA